MPAEEMNKLFETNQDLSLAKDMEIYEEPFDYDGYQVVRGEFFSHRYEPSFTFNKMKVCINRASIIKLPNVEYIQILVSEKDRKLIVKPTLEEEKDSFRWCTAGRKSKWITCTIFYAKIMNMMKWNPDYKYKLLGKLVKSNGQLLFVFDLNTPEIYIRRVISNGKEVTSRKPSYPEEWKNQFGVPVADHQMKLQVNIFDGYALVKVQEQKKEVVEKTETETEDGKA